MADPLPDDTIRYPRRNGGLPAPKTSSPARPPAPRPLPDPEPPSEGYARALPVIFGVLGAVVVLAALVAAAWFGYEAFDGHAASTSSASASSAKSGDPLSDPGRWQPGPDVAQAVSGDSPGDIGWWVRTFDLPDSSNVTHYLKGQDITVSRVVPIHYVSDPSATTITYQVTGEVPAPLLHVPRATWAPSDPELQPFTNVLVLNQGLPAGQFWNAQAATLDQAAGAKLNLLWKVRWDKAAGTVTADRLPRGSDVFTQAQVGQLQAQTDNTIAALRGRVAAIDAQARQDVQTRLAQVPADPPKPELLSTHWDHGDGSGEPTRSAERMGGGTAAGAAGGALFGAAAGDAGLGAGIGAGVGLLGGFIYDTVSKNNDRKRYEEHAREVNAERLSDWRAQVRALGRQRDQIRQDGENERQQALQDLVTQLASVNGHLDELPAPSNTPQAPPAYSDAPRIQAPPANPQQPSADQPSGPIAPSGT
ncbi:MAG: glycine zipper family protein, partial [Verrucomicrobiota bacterium]